jgi:hypothetical protein
MRGAHALIVMAAIVVAGVSPSAARVVPELIFEQLGRDDGARARLGRVDEEHLQTIVRLVGLDAPGDPIRVVLASPDTTLAERTPSWVAGFAHGDSDTVVIFPSRSVRYPHDSLEAVLHHEIAHVLIARAAGDGRVPRWFNEGLATVAERSWQFEDRRHLAWALLTGGPPGMDDLDARFARGGQDAAGAYALASAFVRDLIDTHGVELPARILGLVAGGQAFDEAFLAATGVPLDIAERQFHARLTSWERWVPLMTSPFALWAGVTLLALYAIHVRQRRRAERRRRWDEEEEEDDLDRGPEVSDGADDDAAPGGGRADSPVSGRTLDDAPPRGGPH